MSLSKSRNFHSNRSKTPEEVLNTKLHHAKIIYDPDETDLWLVPEVMEEFLIKEIQKYKKMNENETISKKELKETKFDFQKKKIEINFQPKIIFSEGINFDKKSKSEFEKSFLFPYEFIHPIIQFGPWVRKFLIYFF